MEKMFCLGLVFGAVGGALLVANSYKARSLVKKSQAEITEKVNEMMDERLKCMQEECNQGMQEQSGKKDKK